MNETVVGDDDVPTFVGNDVADVFTGVPTTPEDIYMTMVFLLVLCVVGDWFCKRLLKIVPSLVGYILVGIAFGRGGFSWLANDAIVESFVILGNVGLVLLIAQAGLEMDYRILKLVGMKGVFIAVIGTILPVTIGSGIAYRYLRDWRSAVTAGCSFGPTSAGIAMNVLGQCRLEKPSPTSPVPFPSNDDTIRYQNLLQLPIGQLIVAAAIVDDILALLVLSQLEAVNSVAGGNTFKDIAIPVVSSVFWLIVGGAVALWVFPSLLAGIIDSLSSRYPSIQDLQNNGSISLGVLFALLYIMLPATYLSRASFLLGAFLSGLAFCKDTTEVDELFRKQMKRPMEWLMKLFFAASIGFQVPVRSFGDREVIARGFFFSLALFGKLAVGLLTPNFHSSTTKDDKTPCDCIGNGTHSNGRYRGNHLRDCFVVGFSMMGEAEFAFLVAVFGVSNGLVPPEIYASIVWAILLSTLASPLLLRITLTVAPYGNGTPSVDDDNGVIAEGNSDSIASC